MSQPLSHSPQPLRALDLKAAWITDLRSIILRDKQAVRACLTAPAIEAQSLNDEGWRSIMLPSGSSLFTDYSERDKVLRMLTGEDPIPEEVPSDPGA